MTEKNKTEEDLLDFVDTAAVGLHWVGSDGTIPQAGAGRIRHRCRIPVAERRAQPRWTPRVQGRMGMHSSVR